MHARVAACVLLMWYVCLCLLPQVRDLMVFIEAQRTIADASGGNSELKDASILPVPEQQVGKGRRRSSKR
jgi:hypothetical protein